MAQPAKRRIQPQLISPPPSLPPEFNPSLPPSGQAILGVSQSAVASQPAARSTLEQRRPDPKEDSEMAIKLGMKGRRLYVPLKALGQEINLKKVSIPPRVSSLQFHYFKLTVADRRCA